MEPLIHLFILCLLLGISGSKRVPNKGGALLQRLLETYSPHEIETEQTRGSDIDIRGSACDVHYVYADTPLHIAYPEAYNGNYENHLDLCWKLVANPGTGKGLEVTIDALDIEQSYGCIYDALKFEMYDGQRLTTVCGSLYGDEYAPCTVHTAEPGVMYIKFTTDYSGAGAGFAITAKLSDDLGQSVICPVKNILGGALGDGESETSNSYSYDSYSWSFDNHWSGWSNYLSSWRSSYLSSWMSSWSRWRSSWSSWRSSWSRWRSSWSSLRSSWSSLRSSWSIWRSSWSGSRSSWSSWRSSWSRWRSSLSGWRSSWSSWRSSWSSYMSSWSSWRSSWSSWRSSWSSWRSSWSSLKSSWSSWRSSWSTWRSSWSMWNIPQFPSSWPEFPDHLVEWLRTWPGNYDGIISSWKNDAHYSPNLESEETGSPTESGSSVDSHSDGGSWGQYHNLHVWKRLLRYLKQRKH